MNRRIVVGIIGGLALAAVIGTSVGLSGPDRVESVTGRATSESAQLPNESFAYFSIEPGTSLIADNAKAGDVRTDLPHESFAYWSIEPGRAIVGNAN